MNPTVSAVRAQTRSGKHYLIVTDAEGIDHEFLAVVPPIDLIAELDKASVGISLTKKDNADINDRIWNTVIEQIADWELIDQDENTLNHNRIHRFEIMISDWDNGWFPDGKIRVYDRKNKELYLPALEAPRWEDEKRVPALRDGDLAAELKELGGPYQHDSGWKLSIIKPRRPSKKVS